MECLRPIDNMDNSFFEDSWSPSLRDDLTDFAAFAEPSWNSIMSGFMHNSPLPRTFPPRPHDPHPPPVPVQQPQGHDTHAARSSTYQNLPSDSSNQRRSHLDPPNFPLQPVVGPPSNVNTSGGQLAPLILATSASAPRSQDQLPHRPRHVSPLSEDTFWSSPESSDSSVRSDTPFPQAEDLSDFVDLTQDSSPNTMSPAVGQQRREPKRRHPMSPRTAVSLSSRATSTVPSNPAKRRKTEASQSSMQSAKIEEIDLRDVDDDNGLSKVLEQQRLATIKAQQEQANKPVKLSTLQCIICMENMKDLTATHCGHLFCHACLMEALIAGENQGSEPGKGISKCPVCRKKVLRPSDKQKRDNLNIVPLAIKIKVKSSVAKGKARAV